MSQIVEVNELYNSPWGILAPVRAEVEAAPYGAKEKIFHRRITEDFYGIDQVAELMKLSASIARKRINESKTRFISHGGGHWYVKGDIDRLLITLQDEAQEKAAAKAAKKEEKSNAKK